MILVFVDTIYQDLTYVYMLIMDNGIVQNGSGHFVVHPSERKRHRKRFLGGSAPAFATHSFLCSGDIHI